MKNEIVSHNDLKIRIEENFFNPIDSDEFLTKLISKLSWESMVIKMFGKDTTIPRLQCWIGDEGCDYKYSGKKIKSTKLDQRFNNDSKENTQRIENGF